MTPLTAREIHGNWATLLLPLNADDSIDYALLGTEIDAFIAAGVNGIYSNGSAGEFYTQTEDEFDRVNVLLAEKCNRAQMPFQIGVCHMSPQISRERLRRAKALQPSAVQVILPDWFVPSWPEIKDFLAVMVVEAAPIPLILYNPPHSKRRLTPSEWLEIANNFRGVAGIKVPGGDDAWYAAMAPVMQRMSVFIPGHQLASGLARGAHGAYSNVACLSPSGAQRWYDLCRRDPAAGLAWEKKIQTFWLGHVAPLITVHGLPNMAADKAAAVAGGWLAGLNPRLRWPYRCATSEMIHTIAVAARTEVPELFR
ncbi:MAG: dihydrodipicolinate synthase family protein [Nibricoccus sp.]